MKKLFYPWLALALGACGGQTASTTAGQLATNDFESMDGWMSGATNPSLTKEKAHSGVFSVKIDPAVEYSLGYNNLLGKMSASRLRKIKLHCWVFLPNEKASAVLVTDVQTPGVAKSVLWDGFDLLKEVKAKSALNQWAEVEHTVEIPETAAYTSKMLVYLWRGGSTQPVYLDDLQILQAD
ncbi:hypothetical protein ACFQ48_04605 [Hymenobacter caeli]|uniref:CBM-cenC domain-containing protein n=1 Tax=Hymenobacter caeli TaxID=2735894 RepID=A0ABX2FQ11_9BACT|nr:hypothetical protein [Hymenobacter caeli]NRT19240.1 hypothetical protein [Hymenobacter caeli]